VDRYGDESAGIRGSPQLAHAVGRDSRRKKNPEAELLIRDAVARQPDATYLLVQRTLLLRAALDEARRTIAELQSAQRQEGTGDPLRAFGSPPEGIAAARAPERRSLDVAAPSAVPSYATPPVSSVPAGVAAMPSFLGQAAATAAGVAGGAFLFQGVEDLLGHHGSALSAHDIAPPAEDVTVTNYSGSEPGDERETAFDHDSDADDLTDTDDDFV
jgi:hypothetical protein